MDTAAYKRIAVLGPSGSGKSWFSARLGKITGLPVTHLDNEFWQPGWVKTPRGEWIEKQRRLTEAPAWILDGNYISTLERRYAAADLVILLDIGRAACIVSAARRHGKKRADLPAYLDETFGWDFIGFCKSIWDFRKKDVPRILAVREKHPDVPFLRVRSRKEMGRYLDAFVKDMEGGRS